MNPSPEAPDPREQTIFDAARQIAQAPARAAYLDSACAGNAPLRARVEKLLAASQRADEFLAQNPLHTFAPSAAETQAESAAEGPGTTIGNYKLLEKLGEGGFGFVYMAEQKQPIKRRVALKIIKIGMDTREVVARFEAERQALALMDHPNIAKVFDAGVTGSPHPASVHPLPSDGRGAGGEGILRAGRPYFVMELVRGIKITDFCDEKQLCTRERLDLFTQVCHAVQHAHQKGIIHRDLKPSNILVTVNDGRAVPKIIDFGIAKATQMELTEKTVFTRFHQFLGTPAYMSPEQTELTSVDIDTRSDIYSLGVLLYELLTGQTPFDTKELLKVGLDEMRRTIREKEPQRPSTRVSTLRGDELTTTAKRRGLDAPRLANTLRGDLDWIVMKCLEKDRARRYETANGLASDIQRHLKNEPVVACPPSNLYRFRKLASRNKVAFVASASILAALVFGLGFSTWMYLRETAARREQARLVREVEAARGKEAEQRRQAQVNEKKAQTEAAKSDQVAQVLKVMLEGAGPEVAKGRDATILLELLGNTAEGISTNQPEVQGILGNIIGSTYREIGEYKKAEDVLRRALATNKQLYPDGALVVRDSLDKLSGTLYYLGDLAESEDLRLQSLALTRKLVGNEHADVVVELNDLISILTLAGKLSEAKVVGKEALDLAKKAKGLNDSDLAFQLAVLAEADRNLGNLAEAEAGLLEAVAIMRKASSEDSRNLEMALNNLGIVLWDEKKFDEGEKVAREALAMDRRLLGDNHPEVVVNMGNLAGLLAEHNKLEEAERLCLETIELAKKLPPGNEQKLAFGLNALAVTLRKQNKLPEAESAAREVLAIAKTNVLAVGDTGLGTTVCNLADSLIAQSKYRDAENLYNEWILSGKERQVDNWQLLQGRAGFLARLGRWKDAEADLTRAVEIGPPDSSVWQSLAATFIQRNDLDSYRQCCRKSLDRFANATSPEANYNIAMTCLVLRNSGADLETIGAMAERALPRGTNAPATATFQLAKSLCDYRRDRFSGTDEDLKKVIEQAVGSPVWNVQAYMTLAMIYHSLKEDDQARAALAKGMEIEQTKLAQINSGDLGEKWVGWVFSQALLREAKELIEQKGP